jgi:hypothetical protein
MNERAKSDPSPKQDADSKLHTRWWIDQGKPTEQAPRSAGAEPAVGASFYTVAKGYSQDVARSRLTDLNLKLFQEGDPGPDGWGYLQMTPDRYPAKKLEQIQRALSLPAGVRAVAVDSGVSLRVILTGEPPGERLIELRFGEESSFDAWVRGEWVGEALFNRLPAALKAAGRFVSTYMSEYQLEPS